MPREVGSVPVDRQDAAQHDHPVGRRACLPTRPMAFNRREVGGVEDLENRLPGLVDSLGGHLAGGVNRGHGPLLSVKACPRLPQLASLVKYRDPSYD
jgi:hypothetical protein